jgi:amidase
LRSLGPQAYALLEPATKSMARIGETFSAVELLAAHQGWHQARLVMGEYLQRYDVLLTPTLVNPPRPLGELPPSQYEERLLRIANRLPVARWLYTSGQLEQTMLPVLGQMAFTAIGNITGLPSMSVPLYWTEQGLPLGMQVTGRMCDEYSLYQLAGQLERAQPWFERRPPL